MGKVEFLLWLFIVCIFSVGVFLFLDAASRQNEAKSKCLSFGYPNTNYGDGQYYCIKRENNSDVVVPLSKLKDGGAR